MTTPDFFRSRIDAMIHLNDPLAVLTTRLPWAQLEAAIAAKFARRVRPGTPEFDTNRHKSLICIEATFSAATTTRTVGFLRSVS